MLLYGANVGQHNATVSWKKAAQAMLPNWYPAEKPAIELSLKNSRTSLRLESRRSWKRRINMANPKFPVLGSKIPSMLGHTKIMQRLWGALTKKTPSHLSLVGPRFAGKSVLLKALEQKMRSEESPYCAVILWDLGHQTPKSDEEFMKLLCKRLGDGLKEAGNEYGDHLLGVTEGEYGAICEVIDVLYSDAQKVLMLWDGFDKPFSGGNLTRNLWDNLLDLCRKPSFRLVISSRKELHQLIRDEKSVTSDFWGVFEGIVRVGPFDEQDVNEIIAG